MRDTALLGRWLSTSVAKKMVTIGYRIEPPPHVALQLFGVTVLPIGWLFTFVDEYTLLSSTAEAETAQYQAAVAALSVVNDTAALFSLEFNVILNATGLSQPLPSIAVPETNWSLRISNRLELLDQGCEGLQNTGITDMSPAGIIDLLLDQKPVTLSVHMGKAELGPTNMAADRRDAILLVSFAMSVRWQDAVMLVEPAMSLHRGQSVYLQACAAQPAVGQGCILQTILEQTKFEYEGGAAAGELASLLLNHTTELPTAREVTTALLNRAPAKV